jgi:carbonic anhydrase
VTDEPARSPEFERLLFEGDRFSDQFDRSRLSAAPLTGLAILTCMDARISLEEMFGLRAGDANVIRNAGAVASDDALRSLILSSWVLGSRTIVVLGHTGCGMHHLREEELRVHIAQSTGHPSATRFGTFADPALHVRQQVAHVKAHPWVRNLPVHGLLYEVETGRVREVT